jgi:hypothetical protein
MGLFTEQRMTQDTKLSSGKNLQEPTEKVTGYPDLSLDAIKAIAPINRAGGPDLYNHMPTRMVPVEEAKARGWGYCFAAAPCRYGHVAPRYTSNPRKCVDCTRLKAGKGTIGERTGLDNHNFKNTNKRNVIVRVEKPEEVDAWERRFLESYAYHKEFTAACEAAKVTESQIESRIAYSAPFKKAYHALEERLGVKKVNSSEGFIWTKDKHDKIIEVYINTGDLATARDSIGVTPFEYFQELARNAVFSERLKEADPLAHLALEERAIQLALAGNDKLLTKVLSVKKPEYRENIKVDMNVTEKLDERQISARLFRLLDKLRPPVIEIECIPVAETRAIAASGASGRDGSEEESKETRPVLQYAGSKVGL